VTLNPPITKDSFTFNTLTTFTGDLR
jgi:hypothetical protein